MRAISHNKLIKKITEIYMRELLENTKTYNHSYRVLYSTNGKLFNDDIMLYISVGANNRKDSLRFGDFLNIENYSSDNDMSVKMNYSPQFEKCDIEIKDETLLHNCIFLSYMLTKEGSMNIDDSLGDTGVVHQMSHYMSDKSQVETKESVVYMYNLMVDKFMEI